VNPTPILYPQRLLVPSIEAFVGAGFPRCRAPLLERELAELGDWEPSGWMEWFPSEFFGEVCVHYHRGRHCFLVYRHDACDGIAVVEPDADSDGEGDDAPVAERAVFVDPGPRERDAVDAVKPASPPASGPRIKVSSDRAAEALGLSRDALDAMRLRAATWKLPFAPTRAGIGQVRGTWNWDTEGVRAWHEAYTERDCEERISDRVRGPQAPPARRSKGSSAAAAARLRAKAPKR
jgi:hypothetical protein